MTYNMLTGTVNPTHSLTANPALDSLTVSSYLSSSFRPGPANVVNSGPDHSTTFCWPLWPIYIGCYSFTNPEEKKCWIDFSAK